jgi:RNase H-like domain found in reverse transcriptase
MRIRGARDDVFGCYYHNRRGQMDPGKAQTILNWETPTCVQEVKSFVGFAGFHRRFIEAFSRLTKPLSELTRGELFLTKSGRRKFKYRDLKWTKKCQEAFDNLKRAFTTAPILTLFDPTRETWVETDMLNGVVAGALSQMVNNELQPVAFFSKKLAPSECKYMIHDKELLAIIQAFKLWRT